MSENYLKSVEKRFKRYKLRGEKTFVQLTDEQLFWQFNEESNSIATIVKHLWGNMRSRWTDFLTTDGEKEWRKRDKEFYNDIDDREELLEKWDEGWTCLFNTIDSLNDEDLSKTITIRNEKYTVVDALNEHLAHYSYHIGQIAYIGKMLRNEDWETLSIPKGKSKEYNEKKFSKSKNS